VTSEREGIALDIRFRMLQPHELARAQGFPDSYVFTGKERACLPDRERGHRGAGDGAGGVPTRVSWVTLDIVAAKSRAVEGANDQRDSRLQSLKDRKHWTPILKGNFDQKGRGISHRSIEPW
jgi:hypothetical protein